MVGSSEDGLWELGWVELAEPSVAVVCGRVSWWLVRVGAVCRCWGCRVIRLFLRCWGRWRVVPAFLRWCFF